MQQAVLYFRDYLQAVVGRFFGKEYELPPPLESAMLPDGLSSDEQVVLLLALTPHIDPCALDIFFMQNEALARPYTVFGGWRGLSHGGFLPTGETAAFIVSGGGAEDFEVRRRVMHILGKEHRFHKENILHCEGQADAEPFLSGRLVVSDEALAHLFGTDYEPEYSASFPARRITTPLGWDDLVLPYSLREELDDIAEWMAHRNEIAERWHLGRIVKSGYRCLFYGPPGTGKTLTATLLGQRTSMNVYRIDLSMIVSKYIGETEKNLAKVFDKAEHHDWILFFDEADALFGQRTEASNSNDRHANQEVAYLLQRIEDFPGMAILATNLKENIDPAFFRRFQSSLYFPMPDEAMRLKLWRQMLPAEWLIGEDLLHTAAGYIISGGSIVNAIQNCAIKLHRNGTAELTEPILRHAIARELEKEGKITTNI